MFSVFFEESEFLEVYLDLDPKLFGWFVKTAFYVSRGTFWSIFFQT